MTLDCSLVMIGDRTLIGPNVQIYTATHPLDPADGAMAGNLLCWLKLVDAWIGGGAIICPGVTIEDGSAIGAGRVVRGNANQGLGG